MVCFGAEVRERRPQSGHRGAPGEPRHGQLPGERDTYYRVAYKYDINIRLI